MRLFPQRFTHLSPAAALLAATIVLPLTATAVAAGRAAQHSTVSRVRHWLETGKASWYGLGLQGHRTANGEAFDMHSLTCAHPTLPLGTWIRVTNLRNRRSVFVRVNDRGPMVDGRIVDLSYAAAHAVGLRGVGNVRLEPVTAADPELERALVAQTTSADTAFSSR